MRGHTKYRGGLKLPLLLSNLICVHFFCEDTNCQALLVENAVVNCTNGHYNGAQCEVTCYTGYNLKMHRNNNLPAIKPESKILITCTDGKWNRYVTCDPVDCGPPDKNHVHHASFFCPHGTTYGRNCTFNCHYPAHMKGNNNGLTCMEDGLWSFPEATCELMCMAPPNLPNAILQTIRCRSNSHKVGSFCKYRCKMGYHVADASGTIRKKAFKIQCTKDGDWQHAQCVPVLCEPPPVVFMGLYQCTDGFQYNSECKLPCEESISQLDLQHNTIRCQKDGTWSGSFHLCESMRGFCDPPHFSGMAFLVTDCGQGYEIGAECNVTCVDNDKKEVVIMPNNVTERNLQHWMKPTRIQKITCTGKHQWYPEPTELQCIKRCEPFIADNYCDGGNNRAFCDYDGGDCCASTVKTKRVVPFPAGCDVQEKCACLDPSAKENNPNTQSPSLG